MKKARYFIALLFISVVLYAQDSSAYHFAFADSVYRISDISIVGNKTTKEYIILSEMSLHSGDTLTYEKLAYDIDRIYSLKLFTKVDADILPSDNGTALLIIDLKERWYFFPYPVVGLRDRSWSKIYYGLGVIHSNVGGRNVRLSGEFALGYDPFVQLSYYDPFIDTENSILFSVSGYYKKARNRSLVSQGEGDNFSETQYAAGIGFGKRYSLFATISASLSYLNLSVPDTLKGKTLSPNGTDEYFSFDVSYVYDSRDLKEYPRLGTYASVGFTKAGLFEKVVNYQRAGFDFRRYIPVYFDMVACGRVFGNAGWGGAIPNYGHQYFGYNERIRGYFDAILEGEQILGGTAELHIPLLKPRYIRVGAIPIEQFRDIRYAINMALFADAGNVWYRTEPLTIKNTLSGYGVGIHFLFAYSAVARFEYALPYEKGNGQFIFDIGAAL